MPDALYDYVWTLKDSRRRVHISPFDKWSQPGYVATRCELPALRAPVGRAEHPWDVPDDAVPCPGCFGTRHLRHWEAVCERKAAELAALGGIS